MGTYDRQIYLPASLETGWGTAVNANFSRLADLGYNVKAYGAVGDGSADDTTYIQNTIDAANTAGGGDVLIPAMSFKITAALTVPRGVRLIGAGSNKSQLLQATSGVPIIQGTGSDCHSVHIRDIWLKYSSNQTNAASIGIQLPSAVNSYWWSIQGVRITGAYDGIGLQSGTAVFFSSMIGTEAPLVIDESYHRAISLPATSGSPGLVFGQVYISNPTVISTDIAIVLTGQQATFEYLSFSQWTNQVLQMNSKRLWIEALHIETCTFSAATGIGWIDLFGGHTHIGNATIAGTWNTGANEPIIRLLNTGTHLIIDQLETAITITSGTPMLFSMPAGSGVILRKWTDSGPGAVSRYTTAAASQGIENYLGSQRRRVFALTDAATVNSDPLDGDYLTLSATAGRTIAAPLHNYTGALVTYDLLNNTAGAIVTTWNAAFKLAGAWVDPAAGKRRLITFLYDGTNWIEQARTAADI